MQICPAAASGLAEVPGHAAVGEPPSGMKLAASAEGSADSGNANEIESVPSWFMAVAVYSIAYAPFNVLPLGKVVSRGPGSPCSPSLPSLPVRPSLPGDPSLPCGPAGPVDPAGPVAPFAPVLPALPVSFFSTFGLICLVEVIR